jgi:hypothetical protein
MKKWLGVLLAGSLMVSCQFEKTDNREVVAKVGDATLYLEDLKAMVPETYRDIYSREQYQDLVLRWAEEQVLYQEALRRRVEREPEIQSRLENNRRKILADELLMREYERLSPVTEKEILEYFQLHQDMFTQREPLYTVSMIKTANARDSWQMRQAVNNSSFAAVRNNLRDSLNAKPDPEPDVSINRLPECFHESLPRMRIGTYTVPTACDGLYILLYLTERKPEGTLLPLEQVVDKVTSLVQLEKRRSLRRGIMDEFKLSVPIVTFPEKIPQTTQTITPQEDL